MKHVYLTDGVRTVKIKRDNILHEIREDGRHAPLITRLGPLDIEAWLIVAPTETKAMESAHKIRLSPTWDIEGIEDRTGLCRSRVEYALFGGRYRFPTWEVPG